MSSAVNTARVARRRLRFESIPEALAEIDRIVAAEQRGALRRAGNWTTGQVFAHLAAWIEYGYDGYPLKPPPWIIRMLIRLRLKKILRDGMPGGVRIPGVADGTTGQALQPTADAAVRLRQAFQRLEREPCRFDSPAFGPMSHADRIRLNLRHAELHLGFVDYS